MALIPGILRTMQHYKAEKERLYEKAEAKEKGGKKVRMPDLSFDGLGEDEAQSIQRTLPDMPPPAKVQMPKPRNYFGTQE